MTAQEKIAKIDAVFRLAEQRCKVVESRTEFLVDKEVRTGLLIPTINQLRYAGQHVLAYLTSNSLSDLDEAEVHSSRALFDAYQAELLFYLRQFKTFQDHYEKMVISDTVPQYIEWQLRHEEVQTVIRENFEAPHREAYFGLLAPHIEVLNAIHRQLPAARENLNKRRRRDEQSQRQTTVGIFTGVVALVIAVAAWIYPELPKQLWPTTSAATAMDPHGKEAPSGK